MVRVKAMIRKGRATKRIPRHKAPATIHCLWAFNRQSHVSPTQTAVAEHENSYSSSPDENKLDWSRTVDYADLLSYYKGMLEFRNYFEPVRTPVKLDTVTGDYSVETGVVKVVYANQSFAWKNVVMLFNDSAEDQVVTLDSSLPNKWVSVVNGDMAGITAIDEFSGRDITVPAGEPLILVDKNSYTAAGEAPKKGIVEVQHIDESTNTILSSYVITGKVGEYYATKSSSSFDLDYNLRSCSNNTDGYFTNNKIVVKYLYTPNTVRFNDVSGDNRISLIDAVLMQKYIMGLKQLTDEQIANADFNMNGKVDLSDVVLLQRALLGYPAPKAIGTLTVSYVDEDGNKLRSDLVQKIKAGEHYYTSPVEISYYSIVEDRLPENAIGIMSVGSTVVTYVYKLDALTSTLRVKMPEGSTDVPNLYVWEEGGSEPNCGAWPGTAMTSTGDGWYEASFATSGTYNWIVNYGSTQTPDMTGYSGNQWVIMSEDGTPTVATTVVNVKMPADVEWTPYLYVWQTSVQTGDRDFNPLGNWAGAQMTDFDKDGWYTANFYCQGSGSYNWIVNNNAGVQTADNTDVTGSIWVVMEDATTPGSVTPDKPE